MGDDAEIQTITDRAGREVAFLAPEGKSIYVAFGASEEDAVVSLVLSMPTMLPKQRA